MSTLQKKYDEKIDQLEHKKGHVIQLQALLNDWDKWHDDEKKATARDEDDAEWLAEGDGKKTTFSDTITEIETVKPVITYLKEKAKKGDRKIQVESISGVKIGDTVMIGSSVFERKVITAFGSLEFDSPLEVSHEVSQRVPRCPNSNST